MTIPESPASTSGPEPSPVSLRNKAARFRALHGSGDMLVLPNIWNPFGARVLEARGFPAAATASAALSASLGYADGERIRRSTLLDALRRIAASVEIPVTADIEAGYAVTENDLEETVREVVGAGVVGINLEDSLEEGGSLRSIDEQQRRIAAVRRSAEAIGVPLTINARVDSFLSGAIVGPGERMEECVRRAAAYLEAGADCIYPVGPGDRETVAELRRRIHAPINILGSAGAAPLGELRSLGVDRVSLGPFPFRLLVRRFEELLSAVLGDGRLDLLFAGIPDSSEVGRYLMDQE